MVDPIGTTAAAIEFLNCVRACLYFYQEARANTPQAQQELKLRLEVEAVTFERWCSVLRVQDMLESASKDPQGWKSSQKFKAFIKSLQEDMRFENEILANLIVNVLKGLTTKFEDARGLMQPSKISEPASPASATRSTVEKRFKSPWRGFRRPSRINSPVQPKISDIDIGKSLFNFIGGVKWLTWNKRVYLQLLEDVTNVNDSLLRLLGTDLQTKIRRRVHIQILSNKSLDNLDITHSLPATSESKIEIGALASIKRMKGQEGQENEADVDNGSQELYNDPAAEFGVISKTRLPIFQLDDFAKGTLQPGPSRTQSALEGSQVLIEWKYYSHSHPLRFEQILRLGSLVTMLNSNEIYRKFSIPYCKGLVQDQGNSRIGIIFDIPVSLNTTKHIDYSDLQDLIKSSRTSPPPPGQRFLIAKDLSKALHYMQSVNWLHKSFRSDNIVYFLYKDLGQPGSEPDQDLASTAYPSNEAGDMVKLSDVIGKIEEESQENHTTSAAVQKLSTPPPPLPKFYVIGLDISRPDHPSELSETISISTAGFQSKRANIELYSHPESLQTDPSGKRVRFRAEFDIYSLGLVLLEVGLWRTIDSFRRQAARENADFRTKLRKKYCDELLTVMGVIYWRATQRCLNYDFDLDDTPEGLEDDSKLQFAFERQVVCELEQCFA